MILVERHIIKQSHQHWLSRDRLSFLSKNLYNSANYICRQYFFATGKKYSLTDLYHLIKDSVDYSALPTKLANKLLSVWFLLKKVTWKLTKNGSSIPFSS